MRRGTTLAVATLGAVVLAAAAAAAAEDAPPPADWITARDGGRFRVRFDPGQRLMAGLAADLRTGAAAVAPALELGLLLRSQRPPAGWDVAWARDHEIAHLRLRPNPGAPGPTIDGVLYRGLFLRRSREGSLTLPVSPPVALPLPFDIGLLAEVGRLDGALWPSSGGAPTTAGVVHGEVLADFLRSRQPGRWLTAGIGARYDVGLSRDAAGAIRPDHRVAPMTALSLAAHGQRDDGLLAGGLRIEGANRWSSARGWERTLRAEADAEVTPIALNDRPLSLFTVASADAGADLPRPDVRVVVGVRFSEPLR